jgi:hypothetical protein
MTPEDLVVIKECEHFIYKLARHLDDDQFEENKGCYTDDAEIVSNTGRTVQVQEMSVETMRAQSAGYKPRLITSLTVTPTGPGSATVFCYCTIKRDVFPNTEWHFDLVKTADGWRCRGQRVAIVERHEGEIAAYARKVAEEKAKAGGA